MLIAAVRSLATYVAVSLYVLLMGPPFLLLALITTGSPAALPRSARRGPARALAERHHGRGRQARTSCAIAPRSTR